MAARTMTMDELLGLPLIFGLKTAACALSLGQNRAYGQARQNGVLFSPVAVAPCKVIRDGRDFKVTRFDLFAALGLDPVTGARIQAAA
jgi:hypothetical protein